MTDNKLADALRIAMEWNWLDDDARPSRVAEICDDALAEHDAKGDYDYALPIAEPIPISPDDLWTCPLPEHWRRAIEERGIENPKALDWIEQRARELAQEENYG